MGDEASIKSVQGQDTLILALEFGVKKNLGMAQVFQVSSVQCLDWYQAERRASDDHIEHLCQQQDNQRRQVQATQIRQDTTYRVQ